MSATELDPTNQNDNKVSASRLIRYVVTSNY